jgi:hypothetical protein
MIDFTANPQGILEIPFLSVLIPEYVEWILAYAAKLEEKNI